MENIYLLASIGLIIGTLGTLIGAGGGFILVPILMFLYPDDSTETITAISIAAVACNAISGSVAYNRSKRIDYKAGLVFAICTIPGSILGVYTTQFISRNIFDVIFGILLLGLALFLFFKGGKKASIALPTLRKKGWIHQTLTDKEGITYDYAYDLKKGSILSVFVGYFSPLLGIGGGIIHVPAMVEWLRFPVHIATATSHFILAIMATVSVIIHYYNGVYDAPIVLKTVLSLSIGIVVGAQIGAYLSKHIKGLVIVKALAVCLGIVGIRILALQL
ncbi:MAG: sulfite exporter TauE/SafE family protein [Gelidibacter sp.]